MVLRIAEEESWLVENLAVMPKQSSGRLKSEAKADSSEELEDSYSIFRSRAGQVLSDLNHRK